MRKLVSSILLSILLCAAASASWFPLDSDVNEPHYGTAIDISLVVWDEDRFLFAIDSTALFYSTDSGDSWIERNAVQTSNGFTVLADPYRAGNVYLARRGDDEGFWFSSDFGYSFAERNTGLTNTSIRAIKVSPDDSHDLFVLCNAVSEDDEERIFKSTNLGQSWSRVFPNMTYYDSGWDPDVYPFNMCDMEFNPSDTSEMWIAPGSDWPPATEWTEMGVYFSHNEGSSWGLDLTQVIPDEEFLSNTGFLRWGFDKLHVLAQVTSYDQYWSWNTIYMCVRNDLNDWAWYPITDAGVVPWIDFFVLFKDLEIDELNSLYFVPICSKFTNLGYDVISPGVLRWDGSNDWEEVNNGLYIPSARCIAIDDDESYGDGTIFLGTNSAVGDWYETNDPFDRSTYGAVYRSTDSGDSWEEITRKMHTCASLDIEYFSSTFWAGGYQPDQVNRANMLTMKEPNANWSNRLSKFDGPFRDFVTTGSGQYVAAAVNPYRRNEPDCGDSIYLSQDFGQTFSADYGYGDAYGYAHVHSMARNGLRLYATLDYGPRIVKAGFTPTLSSFTAFDQSWPSGAGNEAMGIDVSNSGYILYAGSKGQGVYKRIDGPSQQTQWSSAGLSQVDDISVVEVFSVAGGDSVIVAGYMPNDGYHLYRTINGGTSWQESDNGMTYTDVQGLASHPDRRSVLMATSVQESGPAHVYVSLNGGDDWSEIGGLAQNTTEIKDIIYGDASFWGRTVYVGTNLGIQNTILILPDEDIFSDTTWTDDYPIFLLGDITIEDGATLTIEAGARIYFAPKYDETASGISSSKCELIVEGALIANGQSGDSIFFLPCTNAPDSTGNEWYGIHGTVGSYVELNYCQIKYANMGVSTYYADSLKVNHCLFENNYLAGISIEASYGANQVTGTMVVNSGEYGIYGKLCSFVAQSDSIVGGNYGIYYEGDGELVIEECSAVGTETGSYYGVYVCGYEGDGPYCEINQTMITGYDQGGLYVVDLWGPSEINDITVSASGVYGVFIDECDDPVLINIESSQANVIGDNDIGLWAASTNSAHVRRTKFWENATGSVYVPIDGLIDLGTSSDSGYNAFYSPYDVYKYHIENANKTKVDAIYNFWSPLDSSIIYSANFNPWLQQDPLPRRGAPQGLPNMASDFVLAEAYPNPFNPSTTIQFSLDSPKSVSIDIFNLLGQRVRSLYSGQAPAGLSSLIWNGANDAGDKVAAGLYLVQLRTAETGKTIKVTVLK